jgi:hypothetical protein
MRMKILSWRLIPRSRREPSIIAQGNPEQSEGAALGKGVKWFNKPRRGDRNSVHNLGYEVLLEPRPFQQGT